jgi:ribosomal protein L9
MTNKITLTADIVEFSDEFSRNYIGKVDNKMLCLNRRIDNLQSENREVRKENKQIKQELNKLKELFSKELIKLRKDK